MGYKTIHFFEPKVPFAQQNELQLPEALFMVPSALLVFDHRLRSLKIVVDAFLGDVSPPTAYARACESLASIKQQLTQPVELRLAPMVEDGEHPLPHSNFSREE